MMHIVDLQKQKTFVMLKPDALQRKLVGEIISRFEKKQLHIIGMKMVHLTREQIAEHYPFSDKQRVARLGNKGLDMFKNYNINIKDILGTDNPYELGQIVCKNLIDYMTSGPTILMVLKGTNAVETVRKMIGNTIPFKADIGTIRGDFSNDSPIDASMESRALYNLIHASETVQEAQREINYRFRSDELFDN